MMQGICALPSSSSISYPAEKLAIDAVVTLAVRGQDDQSWQEAIAM